MSTDKVNKYIKVYGMPRTSTTFTTILIARSLKVGVLVSGLGVKHSPAMELEQLEEWVGKHDINNTRVYEKSIQALKGIIYPVITIKNPYSWYQSINRFRKYNVMLEREYSQYNKHYNAWKGLIENPYKPFGKGVIIRYEDTLTDEKKELQRICEHTGIKMQNVEFNVPIKVPQSDEFTEERRQFYLSGSTFGLSDDIVERVTNIIDWEVMKFYGYKPAK